MKPFSPSSPLWVGLFAFALLAVLLMGHMPSTAYAQPVVPTNLIADPGSNSLADPIISVLAVPGETESKTTQTLVGEPGLSFRYVQTFGVPETAYPADTAHLNFPWGIGTDGNDVWIAEMFGRRALKFTKDGAFVRSIGNAGFALYQDQVINWITDVDVDGNGNIWLTETTFQVLKFDANGNYLSRLGQPFQSGNDNTRFGSAGPVSIAFDNAQNVYVSDGAQWWSTDVGNHRIQIFDNNGSYLNTVGVTGVPGSDSSHFRGPRHIAIHNNILYVVDGGNHRVQLFDISSPLNPAHIGTIGVTGESGNDNTHLNDPAGVAVDANFIYVADTGNHRVQTFHRSTRDYVTTIGGSKGSDNTQFDSPSDVVVDTTGNLYVADFFNTRVQQFDNAHRYVRTYGVTGVPYTTDGNHYNSPSGIAVDASGNMYIVEDQGQRLLKLNAEGTPQWAVGIAGLKGYGQLNDNRFDNPSDVALDIAGRIYVLDRFQGRIQIFNPDGSYFTTIGWGATIDSQLFWPGGVAIAPNGHLYVANTFSHQIVIFDSNLTLIATMGIMNVSGTDNAHFNQPEDVAVDNNGIIYVADKNNHRVQVFDANRNYIRTIGETGVWGADFAHFGNPHGVSVDSKNQLYVVDTGNNRIQIFDATGAYVTTIGGSWGNRTGQLRSPRKVSVDLNGNVFVPDMENHRVQKFSPGVSDWMQVNINGFGNRHTRAVMTLATWQDQMYAGTSGWDGTGANRIMRSSNGVIWDEVLGTGFGSVYNYAARHLVEFDGHLYAGTENWNWNEQRSEGGEIWRTTDGETWTSVMNGGFGNPNNGEVSHFFEFDGRLYASTTSYTNTMGLEIWQSDTGNPGAWARVVADGFDDSQNMFLTSSELFDGRVYVGTFNSTTGGELWRTIDGTNWGQVGEDGFGTVNNAAVASLEVFQGQLYASVRNLVDGGEIWRSADGLVWERVVAGGLGNQNSGRPYGLTVYSGHLYVIFGNEETGLEVWRSADGEVWHRVAEGGWGDSNNVYVVYDHATAVYKDNLYIATWNSANGGEIWQLLNNNAYLPVLTR